MRVTQVTLWLMNEPKFVATADVVLDDVLKIKGLKLIEGLDGLFIEFPSQKRRVKCQCCEARNPIGSDYCALCGAKQTDRSVGGRAVYPVVYPIHHSLRLEITYAVIEQYRRQTRPV